jgi:hypothetical protein
MGCCGQGRAVLRSQSPPARANLGLPVAPPARTTAFVRFRGNGRVRARGASTGRMYEFGHDERVEVAAADAPTLVRTGLFTRD